MEYNNKSLETFQFYVIKKLPDLSIGDTFKVVIYLELPSEVSDGEKQEKGRTQTYAGLVVACHNYNLNVKVNTTSPIPIHATITVRKMFQLGAKNFLS